MAFVASLDAVGAKDRPSKGGNLGGSSSKGVDAALAEEGRGGRGFEAVFAFPFPTDPALDFDPFFDIPTLSPHHLS